MREGRPGIQPRAEALWRVRGRTPGADQPGEGALREARDGAETEQERDEEDEQEGRHVALVTDLNALSGGWQRWSRDGWRWGWEGPVWTAVPGGEQVSRPGR